MTKFELIEKELKDIKEMLETKQTSPMNIVLIGSIIISSIVGLGGLILAILAFLK